MLCGRAACLPAGRNGYTSSYIVEWIRICMVKRERTTCDRAWRDSRPKSRTVWCAVLVENEIMTVAARVRAAGRRGFPV